MEVMNALPFEQFKNSLKKKKKDSLNHKSAIKGELHVRLVCIATYNHQLWLIRTLFNVECGMMLSWLMLVDGAAAIFRG